MIVLIKTNSTNANEGDKEEGQWYEGKQEGEHIYTFKDNRRLKRVFNNGVKVSSTLI